MNEQRLTNERVFIATCALGTEKPVAYELKALGFRIADRNDGKISFHADVSEIPKMNIWSRTADRFLLQIGSSIQATTFDDLFAGLYSIPWEEWIPKDGRVIVAKAKTKGSKLTSIPSIQSVSQKAIITKLQDHYKIDRLSDNGPPFPFWVYLNNNQATIALDTSGEGLHRRGYRLVSFKAPLRETIACSLLALSRWQPKIAFIDPFCGGGTIPIEAAMIAMNIAPGIRREFVSERWPFLSTAIWREERRIARSKITLRNEAIRIMGSDTDGAALDIAKENARRAGVVDIIQWKKIPMEQVRSEWEYGYILSNPPYGERLTTPDHVQKLIMQMRHFPKHLPTWSFFFLSPEEKFPVLFQKTAAKMYPIQNSTVSARFFAFWGPKPKKTRERG